MNERTFEFKDGTSNKFWAIAVSGDSHTVRFGKIGTNGQEKTKSFGSPEKAQADADKLIAEKTGKGYKETTAGGASSPAPAVATAAPKKASGKKATAAPPPADERPLVTATASVSEAAIDLSPEEFTWVTYGARPAFAAEAADITPASLLATLRNAAALAKLDRQQNGEPFRFVDIVRRSVVPRMTDAELEDARKLLRPRITPKNWPDDDDDYALTPAPFLLAAVIGMPAELATLVASWPDGYSGRNNPNVPHYRQPARILFGLGSREQVIAQGRRIKLVLHTPELVRGWLAHTGTDALDIVRDSVLAASRKADAEALLRELFRVKSPLAAPIMLELALGSKASAVARAWLAEDPHRTAVGLAAIAAGRGKLADAAREYTDDPKVKGATVVPAPASPPAALSHPSAPPIDLAPDDFLWVTYGPRPKGPPAAAGAVTTKKFLGSLDDPKKLSGEVHSWHWQDPFRWLRDLMPTIARLTDAEREQAKDELRPQVDLVAWGSRYNDFCPPAFALAAALGMHEEIEAVVASWPDGSQSYTAGGFPYNFRHPALFVLALGSKAKVVAQARRLTLYLNRPEYVVGWLAHTGDEALDVVRDSILSADKKDEIEPLVRELCRVTTAAAAPHMLAIAVESKAPLLARGWLARNPASAADGLAKVAAGRGKLADAAKEVFAELKAKGHADLIRAAIAAHPDAAAALQAILDHEEKTYPALDRAAMPAELRDAFDALPKKAAALPDWVPVATLPPLLVNGRKVSDADVTALLAAFRAQKGDDRPVVAGALKTVADLRWLDSFAGALFTAWSKAGFPSKEKWCFLACGWVGGDNTARQLTPLIREWPGQSQHQRAKTGLEVLRMIGTDIALTMLNGIAQKLKFAALKQRARELMDLIAADRGMSRAELEDRIVPDLDLDERGERVFDYGPRQFRLVIGVDYKPRAKGPDDKVKDSLPPPNSKDDAEKAKLAKADWTAFAKTLKGVLDLQRERLEQAMVTMRRWKVDDFVAFLVKHPVMTHLTRRLVWGQYTSPTALASTFRVTDEGEYADAKDKPRPLDPNLTVGVVHPMQMSEADRNAWGQVFGDYEIVPPFAQLGRPVYGLEAGEATATELHRVDGIGVPSGKVWGFMEKRGWDRGSSSDHGVVMEFAKWYPAANVTAVIDIDPGIARGSLDLLSTDQRITGGYFLRGHYNPVAYASHQDTAKIPLGRVDPVALSETLADLYKLTAKE